MMEMHALCMMLPEMPAAQFEQLALDIKANGLSHPITTYEDKILDGRHRYRACIQVGVAPQYEKFSGADPVSYVVGENLHRRHLTTSQLAMVAAKLANYEREAANKRMRVGKATDPPVTSPEGHEKGETREILGKRFGISGSTVDGAVKVLTHGAPELIEKVQQGEITVEEGKRIAGIKSKESQAQIVSITSKKGRHAEVQKRTRVSNSKRAAAAAPKAVAVPGTPFVKRFLSRLEALTNDLESEFKAKTPEDVAARFYAEFDATDPILIAQFRRAMIGMRAVAIVVAESQDKRAA